MAIAPTESHPRTVLIFGVARDIDEAALSCFNANDEATEYVLVSSPIELAFPLHTAALAEYFRRRRTRPGD